MRSFTSFFTKLARDEDASAAVEFVVLLPVYLLLTGSLLTVGHLVNVRQSVVLATRYRAWEPLTRVRATDGDVSKAFFPAYHNEGATGQGGVFTTTGSARKDFVAALGLGEADFAIGAEKKRLGRNLSQVDRNESRKLALMFFQNKGATGGVGAGAQGDKPTLVWSEADGSFSYRTSWLPFPIGPLVPSTHAATLLPNALIERASHKEKKQDHPIERFYAGATNQRSFKASDQQNLYLSPTDTGPGAPLPIPDQGQGIWDPEYRLGSTTPYSVTREHPFVKQTVKGVGGP